MAQQYDSLEQLVQVAGRQVSQERLTQQQQEQKERDEYELAEKRAEAARQLYLQDMRASADIPYEDILAMANDPIMHAAWRVLLGPDYLGLPRQIVVEETTSDVFYHQDHRKFLIHVSSVRYNVWFDLAGRVLVQYIPEGRSHQEKRYLRVYEGGFKAYLDHLGREVFLKEERDALYGTSATPETRRFFPSRAEIAEKFWEGWANLVQDVKDILGYRE